MIPVLQDVFYMPGLPEEEQRGNCWPSCLASIMEKSLAEVPGFFGEDWWSRSQAWVESQGWEISFFPLEFTDWQNKFDETIEPNEFYIVGGKSPRGDFRHVVIYQNGKMVHDPHFSQEDVQDPDEAFILRRADGH